MLCTAFIFLRQFFAEKIPPEFGNNQKVRTFAIPNTEKDAQMAKLVDALGSGRSAGNGVLVRIQFWAPEKETRS